MKQYLQNMTEGQELNEKAHHLDKRWRAEKGGTYYHFESEIEIDTDGDFVDDERYSIGNYFQTENLAEDHRDWLLSVQALNDALVYDAEGSVIVLNATEFIAIPSDGYGTPPPLLKLATKASAEWVIANMDYELKIAFKLGE